MGDMGWEFPSVRRKIEILRLWNRFIKFEENRIVKSIFLWDLSICSHNWSSEIKNIFAEMDMLHFFDNKCLVNLAYCKTTLHELACNRWLNECYSKPKLRTYVLMKNTFEVEPYVLLDLSRSLRSYVAKIRTGTLQLMIETGRYRSLQIDERTCILCQNGEVETECHFLFNCIILSNIRREFYSKIIEKYPGFITENNERKLKVIMKNNVINHTARFIKMAFELRNSFIYV